MGWGDPGGLINYSYDLGISFKGLGLLNNTWCCRPIFLLFTLVNFSVTYMTFGI